MPIPTPDIYKILYTTKKPIIFITGGRGSGKSFNASLFTKRLTYEIGHTILYTRYTMVSADKSIIPEFQEKIDLEGDEDNFHVTKKSITNKRTESNILFSGIKTSSGNQTAKLKSIQNLTTFVVDEGEEWQDETEYDVIKLSIRKKGIQNRTIIIMNPCAISHFLYRKYIADSNRIQMFDGVEVQISTHPEVEHIHTTYLDNLEHLHDDFLREIMHIKIHDPNKYAHIVIGRWNDGSTEDSLFDWNCIQDIFTNYVNPSSKRYIICDAAKYGRDFCVTMVFEGWEVKHISVLKRSDVHDIVLDIEKLRLKFHVSKSNCLVDGDGVGSDTVKMGKYQSFHGGAKPYKMTKVLENYKNLKTQCAYHVAEKVVNRGEMLIHATNGTVTIDGAPTTKIKMGTRVVDIKDLIMEDLRCIKAINVDKEGKIQINTKEEQKKLIGRSPDFFDVINMRAYFDLRNNNPYL